MPQKKVPLTIILPVKNEAEQIANTLKSIAWAEEIVVVDSQSTDATAKIAEAHGAKVVQFHFDGIWPKKKNWTLETYTFRNEWVMIIDADETLPPEAEEEIRAIVSDPHHPYDGYWINRRFLFLGEWLQHAYFPNWNLRLFKHKKGRHQKITQSDTRSGDNEVHEPFVLDGPTAQLKCLMDHYAFPTIHSFVERHNRYSNWEARVALDKVSAPPSKSGDWRTRMKWWLRHIFTFMPFRPTLRFLYVYLFQKGFLDGKRGYYFARLHGFYEFMTVAKIYEAKSKPSKP
jgi:glycosyltransferase involved in cell wall biosynthesis